MKITFKQLAGRWDVLMPCIDGKQVEGLRSCVIEQGWDEEHSCPKIPTVTIQLLLVDGVNIERE